LERGKTKEERGKRKREPLMRGEWAVRRRGRHSMLRSQEALYAGGIVLSVECKKSAAESV